MRNLINLFIVIIFISNITSCQKDEFYNEEFRTAETKTNSFEEQSELLIDPDEISSDFNLEKVSRQTNRSEAELIYESERIDLTKGRFHIVYASKDFLQRNLACKLTATVARSIAQGNPDLGIFGFNQESRDYRFLRSSKLEGDLTDRLDFELEDLDINETHLAIAVKAQSNTQFILQVSRDCEPIIPCRITQCQNTDGLAEFDYNDLDQVSMIKITPNTSATRIAEVEYFENGRISQINTPTEIFLFDWAASLITVKRNDSFQEKLKEFDLNDQGQIISARTFTTGDGAFLFMTSEYTYENGQLSETSTLRLNRQGESTMNSSSKFTYSEFLNPFSEIQLLATLIIGESTLSENAIKKESQFYDSLVEYGSAYVFESTFVLSGERIVQKNTTENGSGLRATNYSYDCD